MDIKSKIEELVDKLNYWEYCYRIKDKPKVPDNVYDTAFRELKTLEEQHPQYILPDSPTQKVGSDLSEYSNNKRKYKHTYPMLSLDNVFSLEELKEWMFKTLKNNSLPMDTVFVVEPKYDGLAICLIYQQGKLVKAVTRGDGIYGEDITDAAYCIRNIPKVLSGDNVPEYLEVRGEVYINKDTFEYINQQRISENKPPYAHPRNLASGTLKSLSLELIYSRKLMFSPYGNTLAGDSYIETKDILLNKLSVPKYVDENEPQNVVTFTCTYNNIDELYPQLITQCKGLLSPTDGIVFKINDINIQKELGENNRAPRWAIAFKYPVESVPTYVRDIKVQVGRTGLLTPVAIIDPVVIDGVTVTNVTLHNFSYIENMGIGINAKVGVIRSGEVIPKIVEVFEEGEPYQFNERCPSCGSYTYRNGEYSYCLGKGVIGSITKETADKGYAVYHVPCEEQVIQTLLYFVSKKCVDIDGFGEELIRFYYSKGIIKNPIRFYHVTKEELITHPQVKDKLATKLLKNINESREITIDRFIVSLGIKSIGDRKAKYFKGFKSILEQGNLLDINNFLDKISNDLGNVSTLLVKSFFEDESCLFYAQSLLKCFNIKEEEIYEIPDNPLKDKVVVITGIISGMTRDDLKDLLENRLGCRVTGSISKSTDYLIAGENAGSKLDKANKLNISILNENEILNIINTYT